MKQIRKKKKLVGIIRIFIWPEYKIYIEYYGINRKSEVPAYFKGKEDKSASQVYLERIEWKRELHRKNNTTLIERYAYEHFEGRLLDRLKQDLLRLNVSFAPRTMEEVFKYSSEKSENFEKAEKSKKYKKVKEKNQSVEELAGIIQTVILLARGKQMQPEDLLRMCKKQISG